MAYEGNSVWAIDIGNNSLKALCLAEVNGVVQVLGFDNIQHGKVLSGGNISQAEKDELIALSLRKFLDRNEVMDEEVVIAVPSQNSFARFVTLPPVEKKRISEIVKFEAVQQIPFDINEVQWDYQMMSDEDDAEKRVGIFAIKNEIVEGMMEPFENEEIGVSYVQMAPMALYNYVLFDRPELTRSDDKAVVILNVGAEHTDLVVCTASTVWQRCILIGGNAFTRAIADTFKLSFEKAEKLKRTAPMSKYARQIFQAMKPVFTDLASEVQRSLGFYTSSNSDVKLKRVIGMGGGTKLRGLLKYMQQTLQIPVEKPDSFKRLAMGPGVSAPKFTESVGDFGVVYGLALQGLGLARIESNLLPQAVARSMAWTSKARYFTFAASLLLLVSIMAVGRTTLDGISYRRNKPIRQAYNSTIRRAEEASRKLQQEIQKGATYKETIEKQFEPFKYRDTIPKVQELLLSAVPNAENNPEQARLYKAFEAGDIEAVMQVPRKEREQMFITNMSIYYADDLAKAKFGRTALQRRSTLGSQMGEEGYEEMMIDEQAMMEAYGEDWEMAVYGQEYAPGAGQQGDEKKKGFVITLAGYSPYKNPGELLHPVGVEDNKDEWGYVTRLLHLDEQVVDGNSPYEVYSVTDPTHFKIEKKPVELGERLPVGIGQVEYKPDRSAGATASVSGPSGDYMPAMKKILVDPMTKEIINAVAEKDAAGRDVLDPRTGEPVMKINDYWFVLNFKLVWREAPGGSDSGAQTNTGTRGYY